MPFLAGSLSFERFSVDGFAETEFSQTHLERLQQLAGGKRLPDSLDEVQVGFIAGDHLFDHDFELSKNYIDGAVHCGIRIDSNQIPSSIRKAWLQMEIAALAKESSSGRITKSQRQEAKEAVAQRCDVEAASGKYRKMQQFPVLWDVRQSILYSAGSGATSHGHCTDLFERAFELQLKRVSAGTLAHGWAQRHKLVDLYERLEPSTFLADGAGSTIGWVNPDRPEPDYLGNEFFLWLWCTTLNGKDLFHLPDGSEVAVMLNKTLSLECPLGESGKETISAESPIHLPEAFQAVRTGKLPRKSGMTLVHRGTQIDLTLQAETFGISGAKIHAEGNDRTAHDVEDRIDAIRNLCETLDELFFVFCELRLSHRWQAERTLIQRWLQDSRIPAAA